MKKSTKPEVFIDGRKVLHKTPVINSDNTGEIVHYFKDLLKKHQKSVGVSFTVRQHNTIVQYCGSEREAEEFFGCQLRAIEEA